MIIAAKYSKQKLTSLLHELSKEVAMLDESISLREFEYVVAGSRRISGICLEMIEAACVAHKEGP